MTFDEWWTAYWKNRTDTAGHDIARSTAADAWHAGAGPEADRRVDRLILRQARRWADLREQVQAMHDEAARQNEEYERAAFGRVLTLLDGGEQ